MKIEEKISAGKIRSRVDELAAQISKDYEGKSLLILVLANGGIFFGVDLLRKIAVPAEVECVRISSYKNGTTSSGTPEIFGNLQPENFRGNDVLIVDDIIDTGTTLRKIRDQIENFGARSVKISAFLSKRSRRKIEIEADYVVDLLRKIAVPAEVECVRISSYKNGTTSSGTPEIFGNLQPENFRGNDVLIVDDIIDTGTTLRKIRDQIENFGARSVKISAFLSKRSRRKIEIEVDYVGFEIEDFFAVGYGLDFAGKFRNLPFIGKIVVPEA